MRKAVVALIIKDGLILGISRRNDSTKFGLIGGKVDEGESLLQALFREVKEESDIILNSCELIFQREERTSSGEVFYTYCYYADDWSGTPKNSEEGVVTWLTDKELTETHGAFSDYNRATLDAFRLKYPNIIIK